MSLTLSDISFKDSSSTFNSLDSIIYPVGSIYIRKSTESVSPASLFGGTWSRVSTGFSIPHYSAKDVTISSVPDKVTTTATCYNDVTFLRTYRSYDSLTATIPTSGLIVGEFSSAAWAPKETIHSPLLGVNNGAWLELEVSSGGVIKIVPRYATSSLSISTWDTTMTYLNNSATGTSIPAYIGYVYIRTA